MKRKDVDAKLKPYSVEVRGKSGDYRLHNTYLDTDETAPYGKLKTLEDVAKAIDKRYSR